ncbi:hypothetical protein Nepgr_005179 [Nepenthes gracilis]|uniref:Uncharacterized protein n=1 Tax=Nepenthes gracilis TaxID=150966 RepID=A0AAD3S2N7_NEPGR|nr:hypothetical protein Nepgr_005179 [Nepenthes gracilis]
MASSGAASFSLSPSFFIISCFYSPRWRFCFLGPACGEFSRIFSSLAELIRLSDAFKVKDGLVPLITTSDLVEALISNCIKVSSVARVMLNNGFLRSDALDSG